MIWYLLVALNFMNLAVITSRFQEEAPMATQRLVLNGKATLLLPLINLLLFYPMLLAYFYLYPVSTPQHFTFTLLLWFATMNGIGLVLLSRHVISYDALPFTLNTLLKRLLLMVGAALGAGTLMQWEMVSGSLVSAWTPLICLMTALFSHALWHTALQIPVLIRQRQDGV